MYRALTEEVFDHLQGPALLRLGRGLGLSGDETAQAVVAALPLLVGGLACNIRQSGSNGLLTERLAAGGASERMPGLSPQEVFGDQCDAMVAGLGRATGLGMDRTRMLLERLAPAVHDRVARRLDAGADLGTLLEHERERIEQRGGVAGRLLSRFMECGSTDVDVAELHHLAPSYPGGALTRPVAF